LILLAVMEDATYEIIDGMQRLNAFFGFIENEFPVIQDGKEFYFQTDEPIAKLPKHTELTPIKA